MNVRPADLDDIEVLVRMRLAFVTEMAAPDGVAHQAGLTSATRDYLERRLPAGECLAWLAEEDGAPVATGWLILMERPPRGINPTGWEGYVLNMYTVPEWRGRGVSTQILQEMLAYARTTPIHRLWLHATDLGRGIYERAGFVPNGREMELIW